LWAGILFAFWVGEYYIRYVHSKKSVIMGTAVLAEKPGVLRGEEVWSVKDAAPKKGNFWDRLAHSLRLDGYDAVAVYDDAISEEKLLKYFDEDGNVLRRSGHEENNKPTIG
jgi:hypothetical protein